MQAAGSNQEMRMMRGREMPRGIEELENRLGNF
jgi:hypothetical protein